MPDKHWILNNQVQDPAKDKAKNRTSPFTGSDLPVDDQGRIYHIQAKPGQVAPDILLVGDPGRAEFIGNHLFQDVEFTHEHRGLVTVTGTVKLTGEPATVVSPIRTTAVTSGIGTPSLEIVINELAALHEIDFKSRTRKAAYPKLNVIRLGTSGGLQETTQLGTAIITTYAVGMDNTGLFYEVPYPDEVCKRLEKEVSRLYRRNTIPGSRFTNKIHPYVARADPDLVNTLVEAADRFNLVYKKGLTVSAPGFFLPQGREVPRIQPSIPDLDQIFAGFDPQVEGQRVENMEMEASFLLHFLGGLGHRAGAICLAIANRRLNTFTPSYQDAMLNAGNAALLALATLRERYPDA